MRILITGGTGYIGSAVLESALRAGHEVTALVRSPLRAGRAEEIGATIVTADLGNPATYAGAVDGFDAYVHAAFEPSAEGVAVERTALDTLLAAAARAARPVPFVYTSGIWVLGNTHEPATEESPLNPARLVAWRPDHEQRVLSAAPEVRPIVIRPGVVFGGGRGLVTDFFKGADKGLIRVIGNGENRWPMVYTKDLAELYLLTLGRDEASGVYHACTDHDERVNDVVQAIVTHTPNRPEVRHVPLAEAQAKLGDVAEALALDQVVRSPRSRALGWTPAAGPVVDSVRRLHQEWKSEASAKVARQMGE